MLQTADTMAARGERHKCQSYARWEAIFQILWQHEAKAINARRTQNAKWLVWLLADTQLAIDLTAMA